jgi:AsmA protein
MTMPIMEPMKKAVAILGVLVVLLLLTILLLPFVVDLNAYQARYLPVVEESLNRKVTLKDLRLTILPRFGVRVSGFTVMDDPLFSSGPFATLRSLDVGLKLLPLLSGRVEITEIVMVEPSITIIKGPMGVLNISTLGKKAPSKTEPAAPPTPQGALRRLAMLAVDRLSLKDGQIQYTDRSAAKPAEYGVQKLQVSLQGVALGSTPVLHLSGMLQPVGVPVRIDGTVGPLQENLDGASFLFDIGLGKALFQVKGNTVQGNVHFALSAPRISTTDVPIALPLTKPVELKDLHATGELKASQVNVGALEMVIPLGSDTVTVKGSYINGLAKLKIHAPAINTSALPLSLPLRKPVTLTNIEMVAEIENPHARLQNLSLNLFGGSVRGQGQATLGSQPLPFAAKVNVQGVQLGPLMDAVGTEKVSMSGSTAADVSVQGKGMSMPDLTRALDGAGHVLIKDGKIDGVNILKEAMDLLTGIGIVENRGSATLFSSAESDLQVRQGVVTIDRFKLLSPEFEATGKGTIGFDKVLNLKVMVSVSETLSKTVTAAGPFGKALLTRGRLSVPMVITGTTQAPTYALDTAALGAKAQEQLKGKLGEALKEKGADKLIQEGEETLKQLFGR